MTQRVSAERLAEIKREYAEYWEGSVSPFDGQRRWLCWRVRGKDVVDLIADLEEAREQRRVLKEALEIEQEAADHFANCPKCEGEDIPCELGAEMAANAAEVRRNALAATEATSG